MDMSVREDVAAASAVNRELGPDYTDAVSEGLVERIGAEIDKRVDARLAEHGAQPPASRLGWPKVAMGLGSIVAGVCGTAAVLYSTVDVGASTVSNTVVSGPTIHATIGSAQVLLVVLIWVVIAVVNLGYARRR